MIKHALLMGLIGVLLIPNIGLGQSRLSNKERRADSHYERQSYHQATNLYKREISKRPDNDRAKLKLARTYRQDKSIRRS